MQNSLETNQEMSVTEFYNSLFDQYWVFLKKKKTFHSEYLLVYQR